MARWVCPRCDREFGRAHQSHVCVPGCTLEQTFAGFPEAYREIYDRLLEHLRSLGPIHDDVVGVGVFLKSDRKVAEIRPKARSLSLELVLPRRLEHPRIARALGGGDRTVHIVKLHEPDEVDEELRGWLTEAYDAATDARGNPADDPTDGSPARGSDRRSGRRPRRSPS